MSSTPITAARGGAGPVDLSRASGTSRPSIRAAVASSASSSPGRPTSCTATARPDTRTGTTTAGSPARFQACVYGTREADSSVVDR